MAWPMNSPARSEGFLRQPVALPGGFGNLPGGQYSGTKAGFPAGRDLFGDVFCDGRAGGNRLQVTLDTAGTDRPIRENGDMPKLGGHAAAAFDQLVAADHSAADAGADGEINDIVMAFAGAIQPFPQDCQVGVIPDISRDVVFLRKQFGQGIICPGGDVGSFDDDAGIGIKRPGYGRADDVDRLLRPDRVDQRSQPLEYAVFHATGRGALDVDGDGAVLGVDGNP